MNGHFVSRLMWGLLIILVGVALMLRQSGVLDFDMHDLISIFWPVLLLFLGFQGFVKKLAGGSGSFLGSAVLVIVGFIFLGRNLDWFSWSIGDMMQFAVPFLLIVFGISMIFKPKRKISGGTPADDWQAYNYSPLDQPVPPAPPLHPDPTAPVDLDSVDHELRPSPEPDPHPRSEGAHNLNHSTPAYEKQTDQFGHPYHPKMDRWTRRAERIRERMEQRADRYHRHSHERHDRVEWWNHDPGAQTRSGFIGDIYVGHDYWELKPMNISHFIGDTVLDLTKAQIPLGETRIHISSFIGDVKVFLPNDLEVGVNVVSSAFIGDVSVLDRKEGGMFKNMNVETSYFQETDKKIKLVVSTFIGDVRVTKVG